LIAGASCANRQILVFIAAPRGLGGRISGHPTRLGERVFGGRQGIHTATWSASAIKRSSPQSANFIARRDRPAHVLKGRLCPFVSRASQCTITRCSVFTLDWLGGPGFALTRRQGPSRFDFQYSDIVVICASKKRGIGTAGLAPGGFSAKSPRSKALIHLGTHHLEVN